MVHNHILLLVYLEHQKTSILRINQKILHNVLSVCFVICSVTVVGLLVQPKMQPVNEHGRYKSD